MLFFPVLQGDQRSVGLFIFLVQASLAAYAMKGWSRSLGFLHGLLIAGATVRCSECLDV